MCFKDSPPKPLVYRMVAVYYKAFYHNLDSTHSFVLVPELVVLYPYFIFVLDISIPGIDP